MNKQLTLKILKVTALVIFYGIIGLLFIFSLSTLARKSEDQVPNLLGRGFLAVESSSMTGDNNDSFNEGDLILVRVLSSKEKENLDPNTLYDSENPSNGTVITFYDRQIKAFNTHRVVGVDNGYLITQGDNNLTPDSQKILPSSIIAVYSGKIPKVGNLVSFMLTPVGFGVVVVMPFILVLLYQGIIITRNIFKVREEKLKEELRKELQKERVD